MINQLIEEDRQFKEELANIKTLEIKSLEQKVFERFDLEASVRKFINC